MRLTRKPSLWSDVLARLLFAVLWIGFFGVASRIAWRERAQLPPFALFLLVVFDLIAIGLVIDIVVRIGRTLRHHEPVVDIDRQTLAYGDTANVHLLDAHPESIDEIGVKLVGECWAKSMTDISRYRRTVVAYSRCFEQELLRESPSSSGPLERTVKIEIPKSPPSDNVRWKIIIDARLKQGGVIEHPFPLSVRESIP